MNTDPSPWELIFQEGGYQYPEPRPQVVRFTEALKARGLTDVLDLGCGRGRHVVHMAAQGLRVSGLDNAPTALKLTRQGLETERLRADLLLADMRQPLPFANDSFDAVLSTQVIHHALLATVLRTAHEIQRIVRRGGMVLVSVPARKAIQEDAPHEEIEPNTFVPLGGPEMGLPHHLFAPDEFRGIFPQFEALDLQVFDERIIALMAHKT